MKDKMSCFERRMEIMALLLKNKRTTLSELATKFSVHKNTAHNDINFLSHYLPLYTKSGIDGGIILDNYRSEHLMYLSTVEEQCLREIMADAQDERKLILKDILNKFSLPKSSE